MNQTKKVSYGSKINPQKGYLWKKEGKKSVNICFKHDGLYNLCCQIMFLSRAKKNQTTFWY